jgi:hypothetical protein
VRHGLRSAAESFVWSSGAVAAVAELLDERWVRRDQSRSPKE